MMHDVFRTERPTSEMTWRVLAARAFLDFNTRREVDLHDNFVDFGWQISTEILF